MLADWLQLSNREEGQLKEALLFAVFATAISVAVGWMLGRWHLRRCRRARLRAKIHAILDRMWSRPEPEIETITCDRRAPRTITARPRLPRDITRKSALDDAPRFKLKPEDFRP